MKGLILKDLMVLKMTMKTVIVVVVLFGFIGSASGSLYMSTFASVYAAILPMTCMAYDERSRFNRYASVMPINPRDIVLSKYLTGLILAAAATVVAVAMAVIAGGSMAETLLSSIFIPVFYHTFMLPIMFKFGVEKSRIIVLVGVVIPAIGVSFMEEAGVLDSLIYRLSSADSFTVMSGVFAVLAVLYVISVFISIAICKNKEW